MNTKEQKERAEQELNENLKKQFLINSVKDFWDLIDFLYGDEFKKVFAELQTKKQLKGGKK